MCFYFLSFVHLQSRSKMVSRSSSSILAVSPFYLYFWWNFSTLENFRKTKALLLLPSTEVVWKLTSTRLFTLRLTALQILQCIALVYLLSVVNWATNYKIYVLLMPSLQYSTHPNVIKPNHKCTVPTHLFSSTKA